MYIDIYIYCVVGLGPQLPGSFSLQDTKARARASFPETHLLMQKSQGSLKSGQNWIAKGDISLLTNNGSKPLAFKDDLVHQIQK